MSLRFWISASISIVLLPAGAAAGVPNFNEVVIDPHAGEVVYAVTHADVDGDGKHDIVAVTENAVYWYAAPDWMKHTIIKEQTVKDNVCIAASDIDDDGKIDFALGAGWLNGRNQGTIQWLSRKESLDENWNVHFIGEIPWTHRLHWGDVLGKGTHQLTVSPLNKIEGDGVKLTAFEIPANPKMDRWPGTVLNDSLNRVHNHWHVDAKEEGTVEITLTASEEGVRLLRQEPQKRRAFVLEISGGATGDKPTDRGAGEVKTGKLADGRTMIATVEPMHGNMAIIYVPKQKDTFDFSRIVLDDTLGRGHAVWLADFDGDGNDEVVFGHSDPATGEIKGPGVYIYRAHDETGTKWTKHVVDDGGMATEDLFAVDMTGDGQPDIVAGGRNTHNVKLYVNAGE